jgi:hypothetical protein
MNNSTMLLKLQTNIKLASELSGGWQSGILLSNLNEIFDEMLEREGIHREQDVDKMLWKIVERV